MLGDPQAAPTYAAWPVPKNLDFPKLHAAQRQAVRSLRSWHRPDGRDVTMFEGVSLGRLRRYDLIWPLMRLFRQAALGLPVDSPQSVDDTGLSKSYDPILVPSLQIRRTDIKARIFRAFCAAARVFGGGRRGKAVLIVGSPSNRILWRYWLENRRALPRLYLDFPLSNPPGLENSLKAVLAGARLFDPEPASLTREQAGTLDGIRLALEALPNSPSWRGLFDFDGKNLAETFSRRVLADFARELEPLAIKHVSWTRELARHRPDLIILPEEISVSAQILYHAARELGIPTWFMDHGLGGGYHFDESAQCGELEASLILARSPRDRDNYLAAGVGPERLAVAGAPAFDELLPMARCRPFTGVAGASVLVLAQTTPSQTRTVFSDDSLGRFFTETVDLLRRRGARQIIFKLHPGPARQEFYRDLLAGLKPGCPVLFRHYESFRSVLAEADWVIGPISTAIIETMLLGKDYFLAHYDPVETPPPYEIGNPFFAKSALELERNLQESISVPRERVLKDFLNLQGTEQPWHATKRIFELFTR